MKRRHLIAGTIVTSIVAVSTIAVGDAPRRQSGASGTMMVTDVASAATNQINIVPDSIPIETGVGMTNMVPLIIQHAGTAFSWRMTRLEILGDTTNQFFIAASECSNDLCVFAAPERPLPTDIDVACTVGSAARTATLVATGEGGDTDTATLICSNGSDAGAPQLTINPTPVNAPPTAVGQTSMTPVTLINTGGGSLTVQLSFLSTTEWTASACVSSACTLTGMGSATTVQVLFTPAAAGARNATMSAITNIPTATQVPLNGGGSGATLSVTAPSAPEFTVDFGTIPRGMTQMRPITMSVSGNMPVTANLGAPTAPFTLMNTQLTLQPGMPQTTLITCGSAAAGGPYTSTMSLTSNATSVNTAQITALCTIADTSLQVSPTPFDFGEVRLASPVVELPFTLAAPASGVPVTVHSMQLSGSAPGLSLDAPITADLTLAPGQTHTAVMRLDPQEEHALADISLDISVDSSTLAFPVTGAVVRPHASIVPAELDLGAICVGSSVTGELALVNDGTATLTLAEPVATAGFTPVLRDPITYPAPLAGGRSAQLGVTPAADAPGLLEGTLTLDADVPNAPFVIPMRVERVSDGAAISPQRVTFGTIPVETRSGQKTVTLQNCGAEPITLDFTGITARSGPRIAWRVTPERGTFELPPGGVHTVAVEFAPLRRGSYAASIDVTVDGTPQRIEIFGDGDGPLLEQQSFYACACSGPGAPARGWPIALALLAISRRRRSGSSSAR